MKILNKNGDISKHAINMLANCMFRPDKNKIYTVYHTGSGRWTSTNDAAPYVTALLDHFGYAYQTGNDAPLNGRAGSYIQTRSKLAFEKLYMLSRGAYV